MRPMSRIAMAGVAIGVSAAAWLAGISSLPVAAEVGNNLPPTRAALERYIEAASYEVKLPQLQPNEAWFDVHHREHLGVVSGDLRLNTDNGMVHIWESNYPAHLFGVHEDPTIGGTPILIEGIAWNRVDGMLNNPKRIMLAIRTIDGIVIAVHGSKTAAYDVAARIL